MKSLKNIRKALNEIALKLAQDENVQKLLLVDAYDVDAASFTPKTLQQMLSENYICMFPQDEEGIKKMGRNTFIIMTIQDISFFEESTAKTSANIYIISDLNHSMISNYQDRCLTLADYIVQDIDEMKLSSSAKVSVSYVNRIIYTTGLSGYLIKINFADQTTKEVEL